ncbi:MAG TPA: hypothetical protein VL551_17545 [Actinospica sp.]|jgi:hypothetical protein|nr:hypothetical protein [Actinospica sp.]
MTNGPHRAGVTGLLAACVLAVATACTAASHPAAAASSGPQFTGRLVVESLSGEIGQLTFDAHGKAAYRRILAAPSPQPAGSPPYVAAALSPDGTTLAYGSGKGLVLRNLETGTDQTLTPPDTTKIACVNWAPDGKHLAVGTADALYLSDAAGHMTSLYTVSSQAYTAGPVGTVGVPSYVYSSFTCGTWLNQSELVFQQSGPFPASISENSGNTLAADTTTVATLRTGAAPRTVNEPTQWSLVASCGTVALTTDSGIGLYVVPGLTGAVTAAEATPAHAKIADNSTTASLFRTGTCQPILIKPESNSANDEVAVIDPQTGHAGKTWHLPFADITGSPSPGQDQFIWGPAHTDTLADIVNMQLTVVNLDSGTALALDTGPWTNASLIIGWAAGSS